MGGEGSKEKIEDPEIVEEGGVHLLENTHLFEFQLNPGFTLIFVIILITVLFFIFMGIWHCSRRGVTCTTCCLPCCPERTLTRQQSSEAGRRYRDGQIYPMALPYLVDERRCQIQHSALL